MNQTGIYEQLITNLISGRLNHDQFFIGERILEQPEAAVWLSRFLSRVIEYAVNALPSGDEQLQRQIELSNQLILWLKDKLQDDEFFDENLLEGQAKILTALYEIENPVAADLKKYVEDIFPLTGLTQSELFCGSNAGLSLESELKREIRSSDTIYWLVSFIKWAGIRIFRNELEEFTRSGKQLKIITTSYMGATDAKAVEFLASLPNTEVKLSYNTQRERLHAKSYLFLRNTGFNTGYIGSSILSHSALTSGLEWNLKIKHQLSTEPEVAFSHQLLDENWTGHGMAFSWNTYKYDSNEQTLYKSGGSMGTSSWLAIYPKKNIGIFIVTNIAGGNTHQKLEAITNKIFDYLIAYNKALKSDF